MRPRALIVRAVIYGVLILAIGIIVLRYWQSKRFVAFIRNADRVELVFESPPEPQSTMLIDPEEIRALVSGLELYPKRPCLCAHIKRVIFWRGDKKLEASICGHCFNVITHHGRKACLYKMPPEFYSRFQKLERQYKNRERPEAEPRAAPDASRR